MMTKDDIFNSILGKEGGYVNHPNDKGGPTNWGITQATARAHGYTGARESMTKLKAILASIGFAIIMVLGAFGLGSMRGREKAEAKSDKQRTDDNATATKAAAERRVEATREASNVQQTVSHMPDDDVDRELRSNWTRKG